MEAWGEWDRAKGLTYIITKTQHAWNDVFAGLVN